MIEQKVDVSPFPSTAAGPDAWIRGLGTLPLMHQPGEKWMDHRGSEVLGVLIGRASGQPLETGVSRDFWTSASQDIAD